MAVNTGTNWTCYDSSTMTAREIYGAPWRRWPKTTTGSSP